MHFNSKMYIKILSSKEYYFILIIKNTIILFYLTYMYVFSAIM